MIRTTFKAFASALAICLATQAFAAPPPDQELKTITDQLRTDIRAHVTEYRADHVKFYGMVSQIVVPHFDVDFIAKYVLGVNYRNATPDQRTRFAAAFKDTLLHSYADSLLDNYDSVKIDWSTPRMADGATDALVNANMARNDGQKVTVGFRVHVVNDDWKIWDLVIDDISLATNFKTQINAEIKQSSLDDVIARMQQGQFATPKAESQKAQ